MLVDGRYDPFRRMRSGHAQHLGMSLEDALRSGPEAAGDEHTAVLFERLTDGLERLVDRLIDEAAGIDHNQVGLCVLRGDLVAACAQFGDQALGINQSLGTAQADEADRGRALARDLRCHFLVLTRVCLSGAAIRPVQWGRTVYLSERDGSTHAF